MFSGSALFVAVLGSLSLAEATTTNAPAPAGAANIPQCAANCMSIKITEAAAWFGAGEVSSYCKHPEFLLAYDNCLNDNCKGDDLAAGKQAGVAACAGTAPTPAAPGGNTTAAAGPSNSTAHLSGPANAPGDNTTVVPTTPGTNPATPVNGLNGALPPSPTGANATNTTTGAPSRFSGAVGSAAANASSQAGSAPALSSSAALLATALASCTLSLFL